MMKNGLVNFSAKFRMLRPIGWFVLLTFLTAFLKNDSLAQMGTWPLPTKFFVVEQDGVVRTPSLVADSQGNIHAFWAAQISADDIPALYYSSWNSAVGDWTYPRDVLVSPDRVETWPIRIIIDNENIVHAFWKSSGGGIWHATAHIAAANDPNSWLPINLILPGASVDAGVSATMIEGNNLALVFPGNGFRTIRWLTSSDNNVSWGRDSIIHMSQGATLVSSPGILVDPIGTVWVWWQERDAEIQGGLPIGVKYATSQDMGITWSEPRTLVDGYYNGGFRIVDDTMIGYYAGGIGVGGRYVSFSRDMGKTWSLPVDIGLGSGEGFQGIGLVSDSSGASHFLMQTASSFARIEWVDGIWKAIDVIVPPDKVPDRSENMTGGISDGNRLHIFFESADQYIWYTSRELDVPNVVTVPVMLPDSFIEETFSSSEQSVYEVPDVEPDVDEIDSSPYVLAVDSPEKAVTTFDALVAPTISALLLVVIIVAFSVRRKR